MFGEYRHRDVGGNAEPVELGVEDLLPWAEVELAAGDRQDDLMADEKVFKVRVAVGLAGQVVAVGAAPYLRRNSC